MCVWALATLVFWFGENDEDKRNSVMATINGIALSLALLLWVSREMFIAGEKSARNSGAQVERDAK